MDPKQKRNGRQHGRLLGARKIQVGLGWFGCDGGGGVRVWGEVKRFAAHECVLYRCPTEIERKSYFEMNAWELHHMSSKHNGQEKLDRE